MHPWSSKTLNSICEENEVLIRLAKLKEIRVCQLKILWAIKKETSQRNGYHHLIRAILCGIGSIKYL